MEDEDKQALAPKLRFPEFRNESAWTSQNLSDLTDVVRGGSPRPIDAYITTEPFGLNWLKIGDVPKDSKYITGTEQKVLRTALSKTREIAPGDFILSNSMSFGRPYLSKIRTCIHDGWIAVTSLPDSFIRDFLYYSMMSEASQTYFENQAAGGGVRNLTVDIVKLLPIGMPTPAEQQKIADCLTSLDELIAAQGRKVAAQKAHKKGLMQQLFPREGETVPRLRFPEFEGAWEVRLLKEVVKSIKTGKLDANAMVENGKYRFYTCAKNYYWIDKYAFEGEALLIAGNGAYLGYIHQYAGKFNAYQRTYILQGFKVDAAFLKCFLDRNLPVRIQREKKDGNTPYIVLGTIADMALLIPKDDYEQRRIADCLTSLDAQIAAETEKLNVLKTHKQGLMQQLFPSPEGG